MQNNTLQILTPFEITDAYKLSHWLQYPSNVTHVYSNITPRHRTNFNPPGFSPSMQDWFVVFGLQAFLIKLRNLFEERFFNLVEDEAVGHYDDFYADFFNEKPKPELSAKVRALHREQCLPLEIRALPEGTIIEHGVPYCTIRNTKPGFEWLTNFVESWMSAEVWQPATSATTAMFYRIMCDSYANLTSDLDWFPAYQCHDFSFRGMPGLEAASASGAGHLLSFDGTDTCPARRWIKCYYPDDSLDYRVPGGSVPATEHSVMCAGGKEGELQTFERLLDEYPTGILSVVSDTWNLWDVLTKILPTLKDRIMARDGKLVIRPDSGDPVKILLGDPDEVPGTPAYMGVVALLDKVFGSEVNSKGFKQLDSHIGVIYGDAITLDRQEEIFRGLKDMGYASTNVVLGVGSFTYQYVTRDTHGMAIKATCVTVQEGVISKHVPIFKDPITGASKKSRTGYIGIFTGDSPIARNSDVKEFSTPVNLTQALEVVFYNGGIIRQSYAQVRNRFELARHAIQQLETVNA